jgi:hypothetical protein
MPRDRPLMYANSGRDLSPDDCAGPQRYHPSLGISLYPVYSLHVLYSLFHVLHSYNSYACTIYDIPHGNDNDTAKKTKMAFLVPLILPSVIDATANVGTFFLPIHRASIVKMLYPTYADPILLHL